MKLEHKFAPLEAEVKADGTIEGYASKFGIKDQGGDIVVKGAFSTSIKSRMPKMLWQHDPAQPIGAWKRVAEDSTGLIVEGVIDLEVQKGREAHSLLKSGAIEGMSIGYASREVENTKRGRLLRDLDLWEVSLVTFPMLQEATVDSVKSIGEIDDPIEMKRNLEKTLREAGVSKKLATKAAADVAKMILDEREAAGSNDLTVEDLRKVVRGLRV